MAREKQTARVERGKGVMREAEGKFRRIGGVQGGKCRIESRVVNTGGKRVRMEVIRRRLWKIFSTAFALK